MKYPTFIHILRGLKYSSQRKLASVQGNNVVNKIAFNFAKRAFGTGLDIMARLQVLEGASGQPLGVWSNRGKQGIRDAMEAFEGRPVNPLWFSSSDQKMYNTLVRIAEKPLKGVSDKSGEDVMQNVLMSLGEGADAPIVKNLLYQVGERLKEGIINGKESPATVAKGVAGTWVKRKSITILKSLRRRQKEQGPTIRVGPGYDEEEGTGGQVGDPSDISGRVFDEIFFSSSPFAKKVRAKIRKIFNSLRGEAPRTMTAWLDHLENKKTMLSPGTDLAVESGYISPDAVGKKLNSARVKVKKHWMSGMTKLFQEFRSDENLLNDVHTKMLSLGIDFDPDIITWDKIFKNPLQYGRMKRY